MKDDDGGRDVCPECNGNGDHEVMVYAGHGEVRYVYRRCWECDGSGFLDVPSAGERRAQMEGVD